MNESVRRILLIAGLVLLLLVALLTTLFWFGGRDRNTGPAVRSVDNWVTTPDGHVDIKMQLDVERLPICPVSETIFDAVLVIDRSASMNDNNALGQAVDAAVAFAQALGSQGSRVGTVVFSDNADVLTEMGGTSDDIRRAATSLFADGGTAIDLGLIAAGSMLADAIRPNASQVIVLLSDGNPGDESAALNVAQALKRDNIYLVTIGIRSDGLDPIFLRRIATSSQDYHDVVSLPDLALLYRHLAISLSTVAATDVLWEQPYASERFALAAPDQLPAGIDVIGERLLWSVPLITADGASQKIPLTATGLGWHDIAGGQGTITLNDCNGILVTEVLGPGPNVFVSPIPPLLCLLIPLVLGVLLMIFGLRRKGVVIRSGEDRDPIQFDFAEKPAPVDWPFGLIGLGSLARERSRPSYPDALIVGVGQTGHHVLTELRRLLREQNDGDVPENIRLLSINVALDGVSDTASTSSSLYTANDNALTVDERLILSPNLERVSQKLRGGTPDPSWAHLAWWGNNTADAPGRAGARMALFYDLMLGEHNSMVLHVVRRRLDGLRRPIVYVVASLAKPDEGGLALDLPHFIRQTAGTGGIERAIAIFALQRSGTETSEDLDAARHTYAAVRELQRILLRSPYAFNYNPGGGKRALSGSTETTPLDACYLIDGKGKEGKDKDGNHQAGLDISNKPEDLALYPTISDALLTLLSSEVAPRHGKYLLDLVNDATSIEATLGTPTVSSFSCAVVQYPLTMLKRAVKHRFLLDLLFGGETGTWSGGLVRLVKTGKALELDSYAGMAGEDPRQRALTFLRQGGEPNRHYLMKSIWQIMEGHTVSEIELYRLRPGNVLIDSAFRLALRDELTLHLNGNTGSSIKNRSGKLGSALVFLEALSEVLRDAETEVPRRILLTEYPELRLELSTRLQNWRSTVENTLADVKPWRTTFIREGVTSTSVSDSDQRRRRRRREVEQVQSLSLYDRYTAKIKQTELMLAQADVPPLRTLIDYDEKQQQDLYDRYLGPALLNRAGGLCPLEQAIERLGWEVMADAEKDRIGIRFLIAPPQVAGKEIGMYEHRYTPDQIDEIEAALDELAEHYLPLLDEERFERHVRNFGEGKVLAELVAGEPPLLQYERIVIGEIQGTTNSHIFMALNDHELRGKFENLIKARSTAGVEGVAGDDSYRAALVGLTDIIPIDSVEAINEASYEYASDALAHVFPAEQAAAELERDWRTRHGETKRFHPRFVRLLDKENLARALMRARLYGLLTIENEGGRQRAKLKLSSDSSPAEIASATYLDTYDVLERAYEATLQDGNHVLSRSRWEDTVARLNTEMTTEKDTYTDLYAFVEGKRDEAWERLAQDKVSMSEEESVKRRRDWLSDVDVYDWLILEQEKRGTLRSG